MFNVNHCFFCFFQILVHYFGMSSEPATIRDLDLLGIIVLKKLY
jgi:hypothetical protein